MTLHWLVNILFFLVAEAYLDGTVTVNFNSFLLNNTARTRFNNCNRNECSVFCKNLSHTKLFA